MTRLFLNILFLGGYLAMLWGFHLWFEPLAWIVGGVLAIAFAYAARSAVTRGNDDAT